ncbi:MAG TPA: cell division protein FtsZ [Chloroflexota bacterium]|nr:cell division protein FtsZ [Chloroflexota bacterium]
MPLPESDSFARIKVIGVGGGGSNAVSRMIRAEIRGIEFIAVNTDAQALVRADADRKIHIGDKLTKGLGAGGDPQKGMKAAEETSDQIYDALKDSDMVFITAGMGGGTGSGAAPVIAQIAQEVGALTVGVVTRPFSFERAKRHQVAEEAIAQLREKVDTLIVIPNDRILQIVDKKMALEPALKVVDEVLHHGIQGIAEIITVPGLINVDFADVKAVMAQAGSALMAIGRASGDQRAADAARAAISSPLLEGSIQGAKGLLFNITGGTDMTLHEVAEAAGIMSEAADAEANIIFGAVIDPRLEGEIKITAVATGFEALPHTSSRSVPGLASNGLPRFPQLQREPATGDEGDLPSFIPRSRPPAPAPPPRRERPSAETPLPEFLRSLRER